MGKIIAIANQKGGVGKTTTASALVSGLHERGARVLGIDLDPQGNTTSGVGVQKKGLKTTIREILLSPEIGGGKSPYQVAKQAIIKTDFKNLHVIPSTISLAGAEFELFQHENSEYRMKEALAPIIGNYDYIIIDCMPSLGMMTINALVAADSVIIPTQPEFLSAKGLELNPELHNCISTEETTDESLDGVVATVYQKGYMFAETNKVVRPATVSVYKYNQ